MKDAHERNRCAEAPQPSGEGHLSPEEIRSLTRKLKTDSRILARERKELIRSAPDPQAVIRIIRMTRAVLFSQYGTHPERPKEAGWSPKKDIETLYSLLAEQITASLAHDCEPPQRSCPTCREWGRRHAAAFLKSLPETKALLLKDIAAAYEGDPAAKSYTEIIVAYPGFFAVLVYRIAHTLLSMGIPLLPRMMTEYAHSRTGIDIHPGAEIGEYFFIDHGTGVVIGETTQIGKRVRIYQGVTLGALSLPPGAGDLYRNKKRHPTIEDEVIIYANATILGGETIIGRRSVIGGNVWITESVPPNTRVLLDKPDLIYLSN